MFVFVLFRFAFYTYTSCICATSECLRPAKRHGMVAHKSTGSGPSVTGFRSFFFDAERPTVCVFRAFWFTRNIYFVLDCKVPGGNVVGYGAVELL